jgi:hypothetical protein
MMGLGRRRIAEAESEVQRLYGPVAELPAEVVLLW